jgi:hypothetical protein
LKLAKGKRAKKTGGEQAAASQLVNASTCVAKVKTQRQRETRQEMGD